MATKKVSACIILYLLLGGCATSHNKLSAVNPTFSKDNKFILFEGSCDSVPKNPITSIYQVRSNGTQLTKLTEPFGYADRNPRYSPDGETIYFTSYADKKACPDIGLIDKNGEAFWFTDGGSGGRLETDHTGEYIYVSSTCENGKHNSEDAPEYNVYKISINSKKGESVVKFKDYRQQTMSLSPDSNKLLFSRIAYDKEAAKYSIWILNLRTKEISPLHPKLEKYFGKKRPENAEPFEYKYFGYPVFSPDGKSVLFVWGGSYQGYFGFELYLMDLDTSNVTKLTDLRKYIVDPSYSSDGKKITFSVGSEFEHGAPTHFSLWTINADGTAPKEITIEENKFCQ